MQVMLKRAVILKTHALDDSDHGGRIGAELLGQVPQAQQNKQPGIGEHRADDLLTTVAEIYEPRRQVLRPAGTIAPVFSRLHSLKHRRRRMRCQFFVHEKRAFL